MRVGCTLSLWAAVKWLDSTTKGTGSPRLISTIDVDVVQPARSYYWSTFFTHDDENKETRLIRPTRKEKRSCDSALDLINDCYTCSVCSSNRLQTLLSTRSRTRGKQCIRTQCLARMYVYVLRHQPCAISSGTFCRHSMCASVLVDFSVRLYPS